KKELEIAVAQRSSELTVALQELEKLSVTDPLTKLHNRRFFSAEIDREIARVQRLFSYQPLPPNRDLLFLLIDMDHFKIVNDTHGHDAGDKVLIRAAERLLSACRATDLVVRWGGEEFLVVAPASDRAFGYAIAQRILDVFMKEPFEIAAGNLLRC